MVRREASAAQAAAGNLRNDLSGLHHAGRGVGNVESWLVDLEGKLRGANADNWIENSAAARHIVGNLRIELQNLRRELL